MRTITLCNFLGDYLTVNIIVVVYTLFATWRWGDWRSWRKYHSTMLYVALCNLFYAFLYSGHHLWRVKPDFGGYKISDSLFTFIVFPLTALLLLSNYPQNFKGQILRIFKYVTIYFVVEYVYNVFGKIEYDYGWKLLYSFVWLCMMFFLMVLHHKNPLLTYAISFLFVVVMLILFPVNLF